MFPLSAMVLTLGAALSLTASSSPSAAPYPIDGSSQARPAAALNANFTGAWVGTLEYRDFQTDTQVFLPTWLTMTPSADGAAIVLAYTYDDGPAKLVRERLTLTLMTATATLTSTEKTTELYQVQVWKSFASSAAAPLL